MTTHEAIEKLKNMRLYMQITDKGNELQFSQTDYEANELAIQALEKQIPNHPKMRHLKKFDGYNDGWCPSCGSYIEEVSFDIHFCQKCGQRLNWNAEDDYR